MTWTGPSNEPNSLETRPRLAEDLHPTPRSPSRRRPARTCRGSLAYRDEFTIALTDPSGAYRAFPAHQVKFTVDDPLQAHAEQLGKYTDDDMHNVLAYLQTLR